jgi:hypothetical protein
MRTTLRLNDSLLREAKKVAAETHRTLTAIFEDALRKTLSQRRCAARHSRAALPVFHGGKGLQPGVNLDSNADLLDLMEGR